MDSLYKHIPLGTSDANCHRLEREYNALTKHQQDAIHEHLEGGGVLSDAFQFLKGKLLHRMPDELKRFLSKHGNEVVHTLFIVRIPLNKAVQYAVDLLTSGNFSKNKKRLAYQDVYHLFIAVNDTYRIERNETLQAFPWYDLDTVPTKNVYKIPITHRFTIAEMIEKTAKQQGDTFWRYGVGNNCQDFCYSVLKSNHLLGSDSKAIVAFIKQDNLGLTQGSTANQRDVIQTITDLAAIAKNYGKYILPVLSYVKDKVFGGNIHLQKAHTILFSR